MATTFSYSGVNLSLVSVTITNDLERRIAEAFEVFDHGGNKTIDVREVGTVIRSLGKPFTVHKTYIYDRLRKTLTV
jgi:Ca2+-binding EF-hand superfamily protein